MKKIYTLFMVSAIAFTSRAQLVFNENFTGYTTGNLGTQGNWVPGNGTPDVQVANTTPLLYSGYNSGAEYITVTNSDGKDPYKAFSTAIPTNSNRYIFMSFVVRVASAPGSPNNTDYSLSLQNTSSGTQVGRFYVKSGTGGKLQFGIGVGDENPNYTTASYDVNTTYLVVIRYDVVSGIKNDVAYLWINPNISAEPTITSVSTSQTNSTHELSYGSQLDALRITQSINNSNTPVAAYDAFRISHGATSLDAWTNLAPQNASLPVTLTSFNASLDGLNNTKLIWNTSNESGIVSYVVEKSTDGRTFTEIGSVKATQATTYSFTDNQPASDYTYYRLKMVEQDGTYKYSFIVSMKSKLSLNISLSPNPVKNTLLIQHPKTTTEGHLEIINTSGQMIKNLRIPASAVITTVDMSGLANGLYHVVFKNGTDVFSKIVLKQ